MHKNFGENRTCSSGDMIADKHAQTHTYTLITILRSAIGGGVFNDYIPWAILVLQYLLRFCVADSVGYTSQLRVARDASTRLQAQITMFRIGVRVRHRTTALLPECTGTLGLPGGGSDSMGGSTAAMRPPRHHCRRGSSLLSVVVSPQASPTVQRPRDTRLALSSGGDFF